MKIIKNLAFGALAALVVALVVQTSITQADAQGKSDDHGQQAVITFTKHGVSTVAVPGLLSNMVGVGEGDAGDVLFTGEVLSRVVDPITGGAKIVASYHITGSKHSFSAIIHAVSTGSTPGSKAVIIGVVTDGWLKGHALKGEWTVIAACYTPGTGVGNCFEVTLEIERDSND